MATLPKQLCELLPFLPGCKITHTLTVERGSGSGEYPSGYVVPISADGPSDPNSKFERWILVSGEGSFDNAFAPNTSFTMGSKKTVVRALYQVQQARPVPPIYTVPEARTYKLTVENGTGSGQYRAGQVVPVSAVTPAGGRRFERWVVVEGGGAFTNAYSRNTEFRMPATNAVIAAFFETQQVPIRPL